MFGEKYQPNRDRKLGKQLIAIFEINFEVFGKNLT